ncbi:BON domain-containing protein [Paraburkholderia sp. DHOC27]|uniref:BON domain-containing protein n=1 Tax=Paraburkholderia sp. DHOC27 TaxID=2303330 RepID=UPI000E3DF056|nr:BON domain-containing protein [Paraburkholderia sp. DHOC27]RFU44712.1 BON domain-containing protein [Paraburkholderia sp. DHOC27]
MKTVKVLSALCLTAAMAIPMYSYAQASDAMSGDASGAPTSKKAATKADRALARSVRRALGKTQGFDVSGVFVKARSGAVTLSGTVKSGDQIQQAGQVAQGVSGVTSVTNKLSLFHGGNG